VGVQPISLKANFTNIKQAAHPTGRIPLPRTDLVPCFNVGSERTGKPEFLKARADLHVWKDEGRG
jgi:hypothetical protein